MEIIKEQILEQFKDLSFIEETHKYSVKDVELKTSVSGVVHRFVKEVDFYSISLKHDKRDGLPLGTTNQLWENKKDVACIRGTKVHFFGEIYALHRTIKPNDGFERAICNFWSELPPHIIVAFTELQMFHFKKMFGGTADIILYNTITKKFIIADYKTNEDLFKNFIGKRLKYPFHELLESPFNEYQIQFSLYQILFEQTGFEVEKRLLIWLSPEGTYSMYDTQDLTKPLKKYLEKLEL